MPLSLLLERTLLLVLLRDLEIRMSGRSLGSIWCSLGDSMLPGEMQVLVDHFEEHTAGCFLSEKSSS